MNNNKLIIAIIVIILIVVFAWKASQPNSNLNSLAPTSSASPSPATQGPATEAERQERMTRGSIESPTEVHRQAQAKCMDGSALTVTSRDENQTHYRCDSGAEGSYLNH